MHLSREINALKVETPRFSDPAGSKRRIGAVMLWIFFKRVPMHKDDVTSRLSTLPAPSVRCAIKDEKRFACDDLQIDMYENIQPVPVGPFGALSPNGAAMGRFANVAKKRGTARSRSISGLHPARPSPRGSCTTMNFPFRYLNNR
ncbi:hypothetical protein E4U46_003458 [Claviceps purpurea]|nr:hypothetical protein E4U28_001868 [Claviceps purpurea]KAG6209351.1 hypothetical protein E4U50_003041 [Claviceps purpurea]KAG6288227.1 hypothetical protein E4U46_003458 [Claviceps purpurea]KAG6315545.1 hypothetical protein E4U44_001269 [Claviceps purpurea]